MLILVTNQKSTLVSYSFHLQRKKATWFPPHIYKMRQAEMSYDKRLFTKKKERDGN